MTILSFSFSRPYIYFMVAGSRLAVMNFNFLNMIAIIGLGNPGKQYKNTRHNLGWVVLNNFLEKNNNDFSAFNLQTKFKASLSVGKIYNEKIILAKPQTFMNLSGTSIILIKSFYKLANNDIWIVHDDLDLPPGNVRISKNSSAGGHNGIDSIINSLGTKDFIRFRIGIGHPTVGDPADYVLNIPNQAEQELIATGQEQVIKALNTALADGIAKAQTMFN